LGDAPNRSKRAAQGRPLTGGIELKVIASHVIFTAYGFWRPNDPRGSWSDYVRSWDIYAHDPSTQIDERHSVAHVPHNREQRLAAKAAMKYRPVRFTAIQARAIGRGFKTAVDPAEYIIRDCSILPNHVHLGIDRHERKVELIVAHLKALAAQQLTMESLHPFANFLDANNRLPSIWGRRSWKVFLSTSEDVQPAIKYVQNNPLKDGKPPQHWSFRRPA